MNNPGYEDNAPAGSRKPVSNPAYAMGNNTSRTPKSNPAYGASKGGKGNRAAVVNPGYDNMQGSKGGRTAVGNPGYEDGHEEKGGRGPLSNPAYGTSGAAGADKRRKPVDNPAYATSAEASNGVTAAHNDAISNYLDVTTGKHVSGAGAAKKVPAVEESDGAYLDVSTGQRAVPSSGNGMPPPLQDDGTYLDVATGQSARPGASMSTARPTVDATNTAYLDGSTAGGGAPSGLPGQVSAGEDDGYLDVSEEPVAAYGF